MKKKWFWALAGTLLSNRNIPVLQEIFLPHRNEISAGRYVMEMGGILESGRADLVLF